ncbi:hypothetical protein HB825_10360 [Listeria booriae]|nr:hypothetical protein [Listeria booriae]
MDIFINRNQSGVELKREHQLAVSRKRIGRLLRKQGLYTKGKRRKYKKQAADRCANPNLIKQNFHANEPNQTWFGGY